MTLSLYCSQTKIIGKSLGLEILYLIFSLTFHMDHSKIPLRINGNFTWFTLLLEPLYGIRGHLKTSSDFLKSLSFIKSKEIEVLKIKQKLFDLAQYHTARSLTRRSITLRGVRLSAVLHCAESDSAQC